MDICEGYKIQVQEYEGLKFIAIRKFYRHGSMASLKPGVPGFNLNVKQWEQLKQLKRSLVTAALSDKTKVVRLGFDKFIEVKGGIIWLKRLPEDYCEEFLKRNTVALTPMLWKKLWQSAAWIDSQLTAPFRTAEKYELEPPSSGEEEADAESDTKLVVRSGSAAGEDEADTEVGSKPFVKVEASGSAAAAAGDDEAALSSELRNEKTDVITSTPQHMAAGYGRIPHMDSDLQEDPVWYQFRAHAAADENSRKRKLPFHLRRQEAMKLPKLRFD